MAHELQSIWVLIHPPLAILGYLVTFIAVKKSMELSFLRPKEQAEVEKDLRISLTIAWWMTFLGLVTGMIWAQLAWGSFWSWDPKETAALTVFLTLTAAYLLNMMRKKVMFQFIVLMVNVLCIVATVSISFLDLGLHAF